MNSRIILRPMPSNTCGLFYRITFRFLSAAFTGIYNAAGRSKVPFFISGTGLILNIHSGPALHFRFRAGNQWCGIRYLDCGSKCFPDFRLSVALRDALLGGFPFFTRLKKKYTRRIFKLGLPVATLNTLFAFVNMFLCRTASEQGGTSD